MKDPTNQMQKNCLAQNLSALRRLSGLSQEKAAEAVGVTRQALAKWELGESTPDLLRCDALAALYDVSLDDLLRFDQRPGRLPLPPGGSTSSAWCRWGSGVRSSSPSGPGSSSP